MYSTMKDGKLVFKPYAKDARRIAEVRDYVGEIATKLVCPEAVTLRDACQVFLEAFDTETETEE